MQGSFEQALLGTASRVQNFFVYSAPFTLKMLIFMLSKVLTEKMRCRPHLVASTVNLSSFGNAPPPKKPSTDISSGSRQTFLSREIRSCRKLDKSFPTSGTAE